MRLPQSLLDRCPVREYAAGDVVFHAGDPGEEMFLVDTGQVEIRIGNRVVETLGPEQIFGELALIDRSTRSATAVATAPSRLVAVNQHRFTFMVDEVPFFAIRVMKIMADRLRRHIQPDA